MTRPAQWLTRVGGDAVGDLRGEAGVPRPSTLML